MRNFRRIRLDSQLDKKFKEISDRKHVDKLKAERKIATLKAYNRDKLREATEELIKEGKMTAEDSVAISEYRAYIFSGI